MIQAGAQPTTAIAVACELQRDWGREDANKLREILHWYFPERQRIVGREASGVAAASSSCPRR
jgi:hypothetical protein